MLDFDQKKSKPVRVVSVSSVLHDLADAYNEGGDKGLTQRRAQLRASGVLDKVEQRLMQDGEEEAAE